MNTTKNAFINIISFKLLYDVKLRKILKVFQFFDKLKQNVIFFLIVANKFEKKTYKTIKLIQIKIFLIFDNKHRFLNLQNLIHLKLIKINDVENYISKILSFFIKK